MTHGSPSNRPGSETRTLPPSLMGARWSGRAGWLHRYAMLRDRAGANSLTWWAWMVAQGLAFGLALGLFGLLWYLLVAVGANLLWLGRLGIALIVGGVIVFVRYLAAPLTARWIVSVPPRWYFAVEDGATTYDYLEPGRMIVPWRWNARAVPYVDFNTVEVIERVENVLDSDELPVDLEVSVSLYFNPTYADETHFNTLRQYTRQEQFEALVGESVRDVVYEHLARLRLIGGDPVPLDVKTLESVIEDELAAYEAYGLLPASDRPVTVVVSAPPSVLAAYQALWTAGAQGRSQAEILREIEHVAADLDVPFDEALQLFLLLQRGVAPLRSIRETPAAGTAPAPAEPTIETAQATAPQEKWVASRAVDDPNYTPDPFAVRRERKRERRSRRASE